MIVERLAELGYRYEPMPLKGGSNNQYDNASRVGDLVFTAGQGPILHDVWITGKVGPGGDIDVETAQDAAALTTFNCLCAVGAVTDIESVQRIVKVTGLVNVADGFSDAPSVMDGCSNFLNKIFGENNGHARSATGTVVAFNLAVEIEMVVALAPSGSTP
jgi:enamine deaminase RidA (YjgF/YER057c/UK114 family)